MCVCLCTCMLMGMVYVHPSSITLCTHIVLYGRISKDIELYMKHIVASKGVKMKQYMAKDQYESLGNGHIATQIGILLVQCRRCIAVTRQETEWNEKKVVNPKYNKSACSFNRST